MAALCACFAGPESGYSALERQSSVPGPREPAGMTALRRDVVGLEAVAVITTGGTLSPSQTQRIWEALDEDKDGSLDREELKDLVRLLWDLQGENRAAVDLFKEMDSDSDGVISREEFNAGIPEVIRKAFVAKMHKEVERALRQQAAKGRGESVTAQHVESLWDYLDVDGDGKLSKEELEKITGVLCPRSKSDRDWAFKALDADGSGTIEKVEFGSAVGYVLDVLSARANSAPEPKTPEQTASVAAFSIDGRLSELVKRKLWRAYNHDGENFLTKQEIAPLVYYLWEHLGEDKHVIQFFKDLDKNGDGHVTEAEFLGAAEKAFAMASAAWPRPSAAEVVASMRLYATDLCMQGECCARIVSLCGEAGGEGVESAALLVAHGAIEAAVAALKVDWPPDGSDTPGATGEVLEECCKALSSLLLGGEGDDSSVLRTGVDSADAAAAVSRLVAASGVEAVINVLNETATDMQGPDRFELQLSAARVLSFAARYGAQHLRDMIKVSTASQHAKEAAVGYRREPHSRNTAADRQAMENSRTIEAAEKALVEALALTGSAYSGSV